jgi:hypothetical protein
METVEIATDWMPMDTAPHDTAVVVCGESTLDGALHCWVGEYDPRWGFTVTLKGVSLEPVCWCPMPSGFVSMQTSVDILPTPPTQDALRLLKM